MDRPGRLSPWVPFPFGPAGTTVGRREGAVCGQVRAPPKDRVHAERRSLRKEPLANTLTKGKRKERRFRS
jgi:hypothetical protein